MDTSDFIKKLSDLMRSMEEKEECGYFTSKYQFIAYASGYCEKSIPELSLIFDFILSQRD